MWKTSVSGDVGYDRELVDVWETKHHWALRISPSGIDHTASLHWKSLYDETWQVNSPFEPKQTCNSSGTYQSPGAESAAKLDCRN